jgi:hypothetical protein
VSAPSSTIKRIPDQNATSRYLGDAAAMSACGL